MQIVVYTPPLEKDGKLYTYVPHLVEHCVGRPEKISESYFFKFTTEVRAEYLINFSVYTFSTKKITIEEVKQILSDPIVETIIEKEMNTIAQEIDEYDEIEDSIQKTVEHAFYKGVYIEDDKLHITNSEIIAYHKKYYKKELFIITDNDFNTKGPIEFLDGISLSDSDIYTGQIEFNKVPGLYIYGNNRNRMVYYMLLFIKELLSEFVRYTVRYKEVSDFDYPTIERFMSIHDRFIVYPNSINTDISDTFFKEFKQHFIKSLFIDYDTTEYCYFNLIHKGQVTKQNILDYISAISYQEVSEKLKK